MTVTMNKALLGLRALGLHEAEDLEQPHNLHPGKAGQEIPLALCSYSKLRILNRHQNTDRRTILVFTAQWVAIVPNDLICVL
jgi:hypothetical protein